MRIVSAMNAVDRNSCLWRLRTCPRTRNVRHWINIPSALLTCSEGHKRQFAVTDRFSTAAMRIHTVFPLFQRHYAVL